MVLFFVVATCLLLWPLPIHLWNAIPGGTGDPLLTIWIQSWGYHALSNLDLRGLFQANIFYPAPLTLALSDHMLSDLLVFGPAYGLSGNPVLGQNLVLLSSFLLSGLGMYALAFYWTERVGPSLVAGFIFAFFPARFAQIGHIQLLSLQWAPLALLFLDRYLRDRRWRNQLLAALFIALQVWASFYNGYFLCLLCGVYYCWFHLWRRELPRPRDGLIALWLGITLLPVSYPYLQLKHAFAFQRNLDEVILYSADLGKSYLSVPRENWLYGRWLRPFEALNGPGEKALFFGFVPLLLAAVGVIRGLLRKDGSSRFLVTAFAGILALSFLLSFGPVLFWFEKAVFSPMPYRLFYDTVPGFSSMRVPARAMLLGAMALAMLAAWGLRGVRREFLLSIVVLIAIGVEYRVGPLHLSEIPVGDQVPEVYTWLAKNHLKDDVVLELPMGDPQTDTWYTYFSTYHFQPIVNGYSGFTPDYFLQVEAEMARPVDRKALQYLAAFGVKTILIHRSRMDPRPWDRLVSEGALTQVRRLGDVDLLRLAGTQTTGQMSLVGLDLKQVSRDTEFDLGVQMAPAGGTWKNPGPLGAVPATVEWGGPGAPLISNVPVVLPRVLVGPRSIKLKVRSPDVTGRYHLSVHLDGQSVEHEVVVANGFPDRPQMSLSKVPAGLRFDLRNDLAHLAVDGSPETRWMSFEPQMPGSCFELDFFSAARTEGLKIQLGPDTENYPRALRVFRSDDRKAWTDVGNLDLVLQLDRKPTKQQDSFSAWFWPAQEGRYLRVCLDGYEPRYWWSVAELGVWGRYTAQRATTSFSQPNLSFELSWSSFSVQPNGINVVVTARNQGRETWLRTGPSGLGAVRMAFRWFDPSGSEIMEPQRVSLSTPIEPGESARFAALVRRPPQSGKYTLRAQLVTEGRMWQERWLSREVVLDE